MELVPDTFVVLEGLDATEKSTQLERLKQRLSGVHFTHQPSGSTSVGKLIYEITEQDAVHSNLARQFLHLASHAEHYETEILPALKSGAVIMDRCWWSTIAYGWFGENLQEQFDLSEFMRVAKSPAKGRLPEIVFVFLHPWIEDRHNTDAVRRGYQTLVGMESERAIAVPPLSPEDVTTFLIDSLSDRGLANLAE